MCYVCVCVCVCVLCVCERVHAICLHLGFRLCAAVKAEQFGPGIWARYAFSHDSMFIAGRRSWVATFCLPPQTVDADLGVGYT